MHERHCDEVQHQSYHKACDAGIQVGLAVLDLVLLHKKENHSQYGDEKRATNAPATCFLLGLMLIGNVRILLVGILLIGILARSLR